MRRPRVVARVSSQVRWLVINSPLRVRRARVRCQTPPAIITLKPPVKPTAHGTLSERLAQTNVSIFMMGPSLAGFKIPK